MTIPYGKITLNTGCAAYYDSFVGLVPCTVTEVRASDSGFDITARVDKNFGPYGKGEVIVSTNRRIVPRKAVYRSDQRCGQYSIRYFDTQI